MEFSFKSKAEVRVSSKRLQTDVLKRGKYSLYLSRLSRERRTSLKSLQH